MSFQSKNGENEASSRTDNDDDYHDNDDEEDFEGLT